MIDIRGYLKWQEVAKILGTSASLILVIVGILNLSGMSYNIPPDIVCGEDCYSEIWVNSTYWEVCAEHSGDAPIIYKKMTRSRRLWVNLNRIEEFIPTNPEVDVEIMVRTTSRYATVKHPEYGYLRPLKDGDCFIKRKSQKYYPYGYKFYIHGSKEAFQTVKWGLNLESLLMQDIKLDPVWIGEEKVIENITYTPSTETHCKNGKCWTALYSGVRFVYENDTWKDVDDAYSLEGYWNIVYLEQDPDFEIDVINYNTSGIEMNLHFVGDCNDYPDECITCTENKVECKFKHKHKWKNETFNEKTEEFEEIEIEHEYEYEHEYEDGITKEKQEIKGYFSNPLGKQFSFGGKSTTIQLQDADTENLEDAEFDEDSVEDGSETYAVLDLMDGSGEGAVIKFNLSSIPSGQTIDNSTFCWYSTDTAIYSDIGIYAFNVTEPFTQTWIEDTLDADLGTKANFNGNCSVELHLEHNAQEEQWYCHSNSKFIEYTQNMYDNDKNISFALNGSSATYYGKMATKEHATTSQRPYLNITYSVAADTTPPTYSNLWSNVTNNTAVNVGDPINFSAQWADDNTLHNFTNSSRVNYTGSWANGTWSAFATGNCSNFTINYPSTAEGGNITFKIYANDSSNNENVTGTFFFYNVSAPIGDSCDWSSGAWTIDCTENCTVDSDYDLAGNNIYFSGAGTIYVNGDVTNVGNIEYASGCMVVIASGKTWG